jgi:hypothetical protein
VIKSIGFVGLCLTLIALTACDALERGPTAPADEKPAPPPPPSPPIRKAQIPLPQPDVIALELVKAINDPAKAVFFPPSEKGEFAGGVRMSPESTVALIPPSNAFSIAISAALEQDAWIYHDEYKTDGVVLIVEAIGKQGTIIDRQELLIDPSFGAPTDPPLLLTSNIHPEVERLKIAFLGRENNALDNTTLVFRYQ